MLNDDENADNRSLHPFWIVYGAAMLIWSLGCATDIDGIGEGELGMCGEGATQWAETSGESDTLTFYHEEHGQDVSTRPRYRTFNPRLVEGSFNTYYVSYADDGTIPSLQKVTSYEPDILTIEEMYEDDGAFDVLAHKPGTAKVEVETIYGEFDQIHLTVTELGSVELEHCCTYDNRATYLTGSDIEIPVTYRDDYGDVTLGFGIFPFDVSDDRDLTWLAVDDPSAIHLETGPQRGEVELRPTIAGDPLTIELIEPRDVDGISVQWVEDDTSSGIWFVGGIPYEHGESLCTGKYPLHIETLTPNECELVDRQGDLRRRLDIYADEYAMIESLSRRGDCEVRVELLDERGHVIVERESSQQLH